MPGQVRVPPHAMAQRRIVRFRDRGAFEYGPVGGHEFGMGLGAWWKNSKVVSRLGLSDDQVKKISQTFLDHRLRLVDLRADLEKQELRLQPLLDTDQPDEGKVGAQIDLITAARGRLEKENAMMMLAIRRDLTADQWKKLQGLEEEQGPRTVHFRTGGPVPPGAVGGAVIMRGPDGDE
jgi:Spy/CpxP family protein refolding chaperone